MENKKYSDYLRTFEGMDNYVLFLMAAEVPMKKGEGAQARFKRDEHGNLLTRRFTYAEIAQMCGLSRGAIQGAQNRHLDIIKLFCPDRLEDK